MIPRQADREEGCTPDRASVTQLVGAAQHGDREAFGELYRRYARFVHGIALASGTPDDADDIVQNTFVQAMARIGTLREPSAFGSWIATIARNRARMTHRSGLRLVDLSDDVPDARAGIGTDTGIGGPDLDGDVVMTAIRTLPDAYREALILRLVEGLSGPEIAERMEMTHGSVRVNLYRGMTLLRKQLGGKNAERE
jgi:RNA polymerase sigma-70 factor (ECF subfamily)